MANMRLLAHSQVQSVSYESAKQLAPSMLETIVLTMLTSIRRLPSKKRQPAQLAVPLHHRGNSHLFRCHLGLVPASQRSRFRMVPQTRGARIRRRAYAARHSTIHSARIWKGRPGEG
jgi:hypothetical protein